MPFLHSLFKSRLPTITSVIIEGSDKAKAVDIVMPTWIELWLENPDISRPIVTSPESCKSSTVSVVPTGRATSRRNRVVNPTNEIAHGRVMIYCKDRIIIIPCKHRSHGRNNTARLTEVTKFKTSAPSMESTTMLISQHL
jgi:hypothetical protein